MLDMSPMLRGKQWVAQGQIAGSGAAAAGAPHGASHGRADGSGRPPRAPASSSLPNPTAQQITEYLEQRCYKELRHENFTLAKVVPCIYRKLLCSCKEHIPLLATSTLSLVRTLLDQKSNHDLRVLGCLMLVDFLNSQVQYMGDHSHISMELDEVVAVIISCYDAKVTLSIKEVVRLQDDDDLVINGGLTVLPPPRRCRQLLIPVLKVK